MTRPVSAIFLALFCCAAALGADASGVWNAKYETPDGTQRESMFHIKAADGKVTGKVASQMGDAEIKNGVVKGDTISFEVVRNFNGNDITLKYSGIVGESEMKLSISFGDQGSFDIVAKRHVTP
ncbi:MAG: hypothetical protein H7Y20_09610 [Bryobacteraceae bacterium]|nr:hypothetical protein [Bryobacteraceae bacterium]